MDKKPAERIKIPMVKPALPMLANEAAPAPLVHDWQDKRRGTTKERGYAGDWKRRRLRILKRDNYVCQCDRCKAQGIVRPAHEVDHIVNLAQGGSDADRNLQAINTECHRLKTQREAAEGQSHGFGACAVITNLKASGGV